MDYEVYADTAETMVIDGNVLYIGTFNLDPRSTNLNTEVGIVVNNAKIAQAVEQSIFNDMAPENSWKAGSDNPDRKARFSKRLKLQIWKLFSIDALL